MNSFWMGLVVGMTLMALLAWMAVGFDAWRQHNRIRTVEYDVKKLMRHFACGAGYVGCSGGPKCDYDHK